MRAILFSSSASRSSTTSQAKSKYPAWPAPSVACAAPSQSPLNPVELNELVRTDWERRVFLNNEDTEQDPPSKFRKPHLLCTEGCTKKAILAKLNGWLLFHILIVSTLRTFARPARVRLPPQEARYKKQPDTRGHATLQLQTSKPRADMAWSAPSGAKVQRQHVKGDPSSRSLLHRWQLELVRVSFR